MFGIVKTRTWIAQNTIRIDATIPWTIKHIHTPFTMGLLKQDLIPLQLKSNSHLSVLLALSPKDLAELKKNGRLVL